MQGGSFRTWEAERGREYQPYGGHAEGIVIHFMKESHDSFCVFILHFYNIEMNIC